MGSVGLRHGELLCCWEVYLEDSDEMDFVMRDIGICSLYKRDGVEQRLPMYLQLRRQGRERMSNLLKS